MNTEPLEDSPFPGLRSTTIQGLEFLPYLVSRGSYLQVVGNLVGGFGKLMLYHEAERRQEKLGSEHLEFFSHF